MANFIERLKNKVAELEIKTEVYEDLIESLFDRLDEHGDESEMVQGYKEHYENFNR